MVEQTLPFNTSRFRFTVLSSFSFLILLILLIFLIFRSFFIPLIFLVFLIFLLLFSLLLSRGFPPRMHIKLPWGHLSVVGGLAEGN